MIILFARAYVDERSSERFFHYRRDIEGFMGLPARDPGDGLEGLGGFCWNRLTPVGFECAGLGLHGLGSNGLYWDRMGWGGVSLHGL